MSESKRSILPNPHALPSKIDDEQLSRSSFHTSLKTAALLIACLVLYRIHVSVSWVSSSSFFSGRSKAATSVQELAIAPTCPQAEPINFTRNVVLQGQLDNYYRTSAFHLRAYESLGGVVRIPTETFDNEPAPEEDSDHWRVFDDLHTYLATRFPLLHAQLKVTKVRKYALVYHWQGSDEKLKPILLTAHQDVVPVAPETVKDWIQPPYSGFFDGEYIWGRGSCDDKSGLTAILIAIESLVAAGFNPTRSIVLAFGIDEERGGVYGATAIRDYLLEEYGKDAFAILVDEGGGYSDTFGATIATPAVAEKGKLDVRMQISTPGGHSSVPPAHTGIGLLARFVMALEDNPHEEELRRDGTYYQQLQCLAEHSPNLPKKLRQLIKDSYWYDESLKELSAELEGIFRTFRASVSTTQAVDIIHGGVKSNALPEEAYAIVNHRIADYSSVEALQVRFSKTVAPVARKYNISLDAFGKESLSFTFSNAQGLLELTDAYGTGLNPAPVTPILSSRPWEFLSSVILRTFESNQRQSQMSNTNTTYAVAPMLSLGNTDTRHYWNLTQHIFRYGHRGAADGYNGAHTINEAIRGEGFIELVRFFTNFILGADETALLD